MSTFAVYSEHFSTSKVSNSTSIFTAKIYGILEAINYSANVAEKKNTLIAIDPKSSIQTIRKLYVRNPIVQKIRKTIRNNNKIFTLCWVPMPYRNPWK